MRVKPVSPADCPVFQNTLFRAQQKSNGWKTLITSSSSTCKCSCCLPRLFKRDYKLQFLDDVLIILLTTLHIEVGTEKNIKKNLLWWILYISFTRLINLLLISSCIKHSGSNSHPSSPSEYYHSKKLKRHRIHSCSNLNIGFFFFFPEKELTSRTWLRLGAKLNFYFFWTWWESNLYKNCLDCFLLGREAERELGKQEE